MLTQQIKDRVIAKLRAGIALAEAKYNRTFTMPSVSYNLTGNTAGRASYSRWMIKLNASILVQNADAFIARTVPHELAHLITDQVYPELRQNVRVVWTRSGRVRRAKTEAHGPHWKSVMRVLGVQDISRCHNYDVSNITRRKASYNYACPCGVVIPLGPKRHRTEQAKPGTYWHRTCRGKRLVLQGQAPKVAVKTPTTQPSAPRAGSKKEQAIALYRQFNGTYDRNGMIQLFVRMLGMSQAGASTYYYNCQKAA